MNGKQLKNSILQWAIQGRLVPQDPTDEPASVLLQRIQAEKAKLVKEGKLKKSALSDSHIFRGEDNKYYEKVGKTITCIDEEIPFEIPEAWEWVRLGNISYSVGNKGNQIKTSEIKSFGKFAVVSQGKQLIDGFCDEENKSINDLPIVMFGDHTRIVKYVDFPFIIGADGTKFVKGVLIDQKYLFYLLKYVSVLLRDRGYARHYALLCSKLLPLPPLAEQHRIVAKVEELLSVVERYEKAQDALDALCNSLDGRLRKSILSEAIQGHLVPQDPTDEPASVLLQRIQAEKAKLVKEGKLKKSALSDSVIFRGEDNKYYEKTGETITCIDEDIPFEIPETWEWVRLRDIGETFGGYAFKSAEYTNSGIRVVRISDFDDRGLLYKEFKYFPLSPNLNNYRILSGSILMCMTGGTVGKACLLEQISEEMYLNQRVAMIRSMHVDLRYLYSILISPYIREFIRSQKTSTNDNISMDTINHLLLPLPPLAEQHRIVSKVEELFAVLDRLACK